MMILIRLYQNLSDALLIAFNLFHRSAEIFEAILAQYLSEIKHAYNKSKLRLISGVPSSLNVQ